MPYVKPIPGHTRAGGIMRYLEKEGRALARDFQHLDAPMAGLGEGGRPEYGRFDWAREMDATRHALGNDTPWKGRRARTFMHYVLSPDPEDRIDLEALRALSCRWVAEHFPDHEVAIVYHDDNEHHVPHAHIVVNNTNLVTGRRLQVPNPRELTASCQAIAAEAGLSHFEGPSTVDGRRAEAEVYQRTHKDRPERSLQERGEYSWVADIRARVDVAKGVSRNVDDFLDAMRAMGVSVRESATRRGDWVYSLAETPSRQVTGSRLGASYTKREVASWLRSPVRTRLGTVSTTNVQVVAANAIEVHDLRELTRLSEAVSAISHGGYASLRDIDAAIERARSAPGREATASRLARVREFCAEHRILPEVAAAGTSRAGKPQRQQSARASHQRGQHGGSQRRERQQDRRRERGER